MKRRDGYLFHKEQELVIINSLNPCRDWNMGRTTASKIEASAHNSICSTSVSGGMVTPTISLKYFLKDVLVALYLTSLLNSVIERNSTTLAITYILVNYKESDGA